MIQPDGQTIKIEPNSHIEKGNSLIVAWSTRKFYIMNSAEKMTISAASDILKFLEEPDGQSVAVLTTVHKNITYYLSSTNYFICTLTPVGIMKQLEKNGLTIPITRALISTNE
ncbi:hypothetical protein KHA80_10235 [Anaerobacillus sp. HL2]|nr:hypothetical protein KHA80_10235 [Anaerobacillus sp. HL2]